MKETVESYFQEDTITVQQKMKLVICGSERHTDYMQDYYEFFFFILKRNHLVWISKIIEDKAHFFLFTDLKI